ncbi:MULTISPECIES: PAS domain-containing sensor histidine kinase [unclassified Azospirillum]|uniref:PAS domain-containing sensor histidine kinase n=1 Tax=unclassified Azospirillum TaxID=2630922 RepID=UPI000B7138D7|nr:MULTISPECIES: PAS domain-containing sensor histidine kinase [unclassified Azospirillum]SNR85391.1 PAS domain S-box-containing protein [Azospirillum sp. RU38E]SNS01304.1 PAS domain S-box-containing protein [Azospirillum sp. RU37A]
MIAADTSGFPDPTGFGLGDGRLMAAYFESTQQMLILLDPDGLVLSANRAALRSGGLLLQSLIGRPLWSTPWWQGAALEQERLRAAILASARRGATIRMDLQTGPGFMAPLIFDLALTPILDERGRVHRLMVEGRDVTEAREIETALRTNEQRLRDMVEGSVQGIVVHQGGHILFANPAFLEMTGYADLGALRRAGISSIILTSELETAQMEWQRLLAGDQLPVQRNRMLRCQDGALIFVDVLARAVDWDGHKAIQATLVDVTAQTQAATAEAARLAAEEASRAKSAFIATMSHELRTPLNAILGFAGMIAADAGPDDPHAEYADDIIMAARHLLSLINDMLDLSKIEAGRLVLDLCWIPLEHELRQVRRIAQGLVRAKELAFDLEMTGAEGVQLLGDERAVRQLLLNIVGNAVKFTPDGGSIRIKVGLEADGDLTIVVADSGVGIQPDDLHRIWRPFEQVGRVQDHQHGTGLGLSIARALAELHGASVSVESRPGEGTAFSFRFPASNVAIAQPPGERPAA